MRLLKHRDGTIYVWTEALAKKPELEEYLGRVVRLKPLTPYPDTPIKTNVVRFYLEAGGIGDAVCGMYTACGIANSGVKVEFYTKRKAWLSGVSHPGVTVIDGQAGFDASNDYDGHLAAMYQRKVASVASWYCQNLAKFYAIGVCEPARPKTIPAFRKADHIVLAPFADGRPRTWPLQQWRRLVRLLHRHRLVVIGAQNHEPLLKEQFYGDNVELRIGRDPEEVVELIGSARLIIANDSGPAHLAGLLNVKCIALMAQLDPELIFREGPSVVAIQPSTRCVRCHWQADGGWDRWCELGCSALYTINPEEVCERAESAAAAAAEGKRNDLRVDSASRGT